MGRVIGVVLVAGLLAAATAAPSPAGPLDQRVVALGFTYLPDEVTVVQGEVLEFTNLDVAFHDVVALRNGADGKPAFATDLLSTGETSVIEDLEKLPAGVYDFTCTLHPSMLGTLFLEEAGA